MSMGPSSTIFGTKFMRNASGEVIRIENGKPFTFSQGYAANIQKTGEPGLILHGNRTTLHFYEGTIVLPRDYNSKTFNNMGDFIDYVAAKYHIDLRAHNGERLHLIACMAAGDTGTAQRLANNLKWPVVAYGKPGQIIRSPDVKNVKYSNAHIISNVAERKAFRSNFKSYNLLSKMYKLLTSLLLAYFSLVGKGYFHILYLPIIPDNLKSYSLFFR